MAYPTQVTIASGKTVYEGDSENENGITSRQVQVSVTYQLERADDDLLHVTAVKAREVDAAQEAVWRQVRREQTEMELPPPPSDEDAPRLDQDMDEDRDGQGGDDGEPPGEPVDDFLGDEDPPFYGGHGGGAGNGRGGMPPPYHPAGPPQAENSCRSGTGNGSGHDGHDGTPPARVPLSIRKPQRLAIEAQARRLGLSDSALAETIRERFGKTSFTPRFAVDKLTKDEATTLLHALQALGHGEAAQTATATAGPTRH